MKAYRCTCGGRVFFDNVSCLSCGRDLGFDPVRGDVVALRDGARARREPHVAAENDGRAYRLCANDAAHGVCNWLLAAGDPDELCVSCRLNRTIPNLDDPKNLPRWSSREASTNRYIAAGNANHASPTIDMSSPGSPVEGTSRSHSHSRATSDSAKSPRTVSARLLRNRTTTRSAFLSR